MTTVNDRSPVASPTRPRLRGWLHLGAFPAVLVAGLVLVALGPSVQARLASAVYVAASGMLFGISGTYHRQRSHRLIGCCAASTTPTST